MGSVGVRRHHRVLQRVILEFDKRIQGILGGRA